MTTPTNQLAERTRPADQRASGGATTRNQPGVAREKRHEDLEIPGMEPWLWWAFAAFVPMMAGLFLPRTLMIPLGAASAALLLVAIGKLIAQERRKAGANRARAER